MDVALRSTGYLLSLQMKAVHVPLSLARFWLTATANVAITLFALFGLMPNEYANRVKVRLGFHQRSNQVQAPCNEAQPCAFAGSA